jgi:16S rRNA (uracil1498-N3)-methyltransferase
VSLDPHVLVSTPLDPDQGRLEFADATMHHLRRVLRLEDGATLSVTDGAGRRATASLTTTGAQLTSEVEVSAQRRPELVLVQALAKGRRLDDAVRSVCELGVDRIVPVIAERTQGRPGHDERAALRARWRALALSALEQSRSDRLVRIDEVCMFGDAIDRGDLAGQRLIAVPGAHALPDVLGGLDAHERVSVAIGPEGGWTPSEVALARGAGWVEAGLGPSVLRAEHAGLVALSVMAAGTGRWRLDG